MESSAPLVVITGPTGSGKTGLAIEFAEKFGGEIICADSRTVYKGMDVGTAKPTREEQARVPHHLLDVVEPGERFTVHDFQKLARQAIVEIRTRGRIPFIVGGTGLYIDSIVLEYEFPEDDAVRRQKLSVKPIEELQLMIKNQRLTMPHNEQNKRHLVQILMTEGRTMAAREKPNGSTYVVAIATEKDTLEQRLIARAHEMFASGVLDEAQALGEKYGWESEAMTGNIYPLLRQVIDNELTQEQAEELSIIRDRQLAKRQITWLKRHDYVEWLSLEEAKMFLDGVLSKHA